MIQGLLLLLLRLRRLLLLCLLFLRHLLLLLLLLILLLLLLIIIIILPLLLFLLLLLLLLLLLPRRPPLLWHYNPIRTFSQSALFFDLSCQFVNPFPTAQVDSTRTFPRSQFIFPCGRLSTGLSPNANLEVQSTIFINPETGWPSCIPRHQVPIFVAWCNLHGLQWYCSFPQSPQREISH